jgi:transcriptional regulator with XRE-family HTH domain
MKFNRKKKCEAKSKLIDHQVIRELRLELGMTLKQASEKLEVGAKGLGAIENGRVYLDKKRVEEIVTSYDLTYLDFVRKKKAIENDSQKRKGRSFVRHVLTNNDRRSYQKIITKECRVIKSMRRTKGISQDQASKLCGYSRPTIGHIENGRIELSLDRIRHIVHTYGYKIKDFEDNMNKEEFRDQVIDSCIEKIKQLDDTKLDIVKNLLGSL